MTRVGCRSAHTTGNILRLIGGQGVLLAGLGATAGLVSGYVAGRSMDALLSGVRAADPLTFAAAASVAVVMAVLGRVRPALRASRVDPTVPMRTE